MTRIIGCGTDHRGDDAAGLLVARELGEVAHSGDGLSLIEAWQGCDELILIDAVVTGAPPGEIVVWDGRRAPATASVFRSSSHTFGVAEALQLARLLDRLPASVTIFGIEAATFRIGAPPSAPVAAAIERLVQRIKNLHAAPVAPDIHMNPGTVAKPVH